MRNIVWKLLGVLMVVVAPIVTRGLIYLGYPALVSASDLRGFISDAAVMLCSVLVLTLIFKNQKKVTLIVLCCIFSMLSIVNFEHILALDSSISLRSLHFLADPEFRAGSAGLSLMSFGMVVFFTFSLVLLVWEKKLLSACNAKFLSPLVSFLIITLLIWPVEPSVALWRQQNVIAENLLFEIAKIKKSVKHKVAGKASSEFEYIITQTDLSGEKRYRGDKKNILLIMMESISGHHVYRPNSESDQYDIVYMPKLAERLKGSLSYTHFIAPQVQTNRGEYTIICGDHPNLASHVAKMEIAEAIMDKKNRRCLPEILKADGYSTSYLQAAPMSFMNKDEFMPPAGFGRAKGTNWFKKPFFKHTWGVGDDDFFQQSLREVKRLREGEKPWFLTLLTVGTHHNYSVPPEFVKPDMSLFANAVDYLDYALDRYLDELARMGVLEDTLIIITSDESKGSVTDKTNLMKSWVPLIVIDSSAPNEIISESFTSADLSLSVLDYLEINSIPDLPPGRSIFRAYSEPRPFVFSQYHDLVSYLFTTDNKLLKCDYHFTRCFESQYPDQHFLWAPLRENSSVAEASKVIALEQLVNANDWDFERFIDKSKGVDDTKPWSGFYYTSLDLSGKALRYYHDSIQFKWKDGAPFVGIPSERFSAKWETCLNNEAILDVKFSVKADDGSRLYVDGELVLDKWREFSGKRVAKEVELQPGSHHIVLEYWDFYFNAEVSLDIEERVGNQYEAFSSDYLRPPAYENTIAKCGG